MGLYPPELIELDDVTLRRSVVADAEDDAAAVRDNLAHLAPYMPWANETSASVEFQRERLVKVQQEWEARTGFRYTLRDRQGVFLGHISLECRLEPGAIEIGYWLVGSATGRGYATAAAAALTAAGLALDDVTRVEIHCDETNLRSARIPQRLGYRLDRIEHEEILAPAQTGHQMIWVYPHPPPP